MQTQTPSAARHGSCFAHTLRAGGWRSRRESSPEQLEARFRKRSGVGHHFIVEDKAATKLVVGVALVFRRRSPQPGGSIHGSKARSGSPSCCYHKARNQGAWYHVCVKCSFELGAEEEEVWESPPACPTAATGGRGNDCLCCTVEPRQRVTKRKRKSTLSPTKNQKANKAVKQARRQSNEGEGE
jgi:hypothetical protein